MQLQVTLERAMIMQSDYLIDELLSLGERTAWALKRGDESNASMLNYAASIGHLAVQSGDVEEWLDRGKSMRERLPSRQDVWNWNAPLHFEEILLRTREKLATERALVGRTVTPEDWISEELLEELKEVQLDIEKKIFASASRIMGRVVELEGLASDNGAAGVYGCAWLWHQCLRSGRQDLEVLLPPGRIKWMIGAVAEGRQGSNGEISSEWETPILNEAANCCFLLTFENRIPQWKELVDVVAIPTLMAFSSQTGFIDAMQRLQAVSGLALLISEIRQDGSAVKCVMERLERLLGNESARWDLVEKRWGPGAWG